MIDRCNCIACAWWRLARCLFVAGVLALALLAVLHRNDGRDRLLIDPQPFDTSEHDWIAQAGSWSPDSPLYPPEQFRAHGAAVVVYGGPEIVHELCGSPPEGKVRFGCGGQKEDGTPIIVIANPCLLEKDFYAAITCHELGHVNGWKHDQPRKAQP